MPLPFVMDPNGHIVINNASGNGSGINYTKLSSFMAINGSTNTSSSNAPDGGSYHNLVLASTKYSGSTSSPYCMALGVDYTSGHGYINAAGAGGTQPIYINSRGGDVVIGFSGLPGITPISTSNLSVTGSISTYSTIYGGTYTALNSGSISTSGLISGGTITATGQISAASFNSGSDYRIKENVTKLDSSFNVDNLNPVTYINKNMGKQDIGFIAHEVQEIYPFLVNGEKDGEETQSLNYIGLIGILTKELQDLKKRVKELENNKL
jgi:hypothetical protein